MSIYISVGEMFEIVAEKHFPGVFDGWTVGTTLPHVTIDGVEKFEFREFEDGFRRIAVYDENTVGIAAMVIVAPMAVGYDHIERMVELLNQELPMYRLVMS